jgi:hypothetical protein
MADTDKTRPWRIQQAEGMRETSRRWSSPHKSAVGWLQRKYNRQDRHDARADVRRGREPEPRQARGRAWWETW